MNTYTLAGKIRHIINLCIFSLLLLTTTHARAHDIVCPPPELIGSVGMPATAAYFVFDQTTAYIMVEGPQLILVDIADPANLTIVGSTDIPQISTWIAAEVYQDTLYIFDDNAFLIIDVSDPTAPQYIATYTTNTPATDVATLHNGYMYIGTASRTLEIIDLSDPLAPAFVSIESDHEGLLAVIDGIGYTTQAQAVDLSDPLNPTPLATAPQSTRYLRYHRDQNIFYALKTDRGATIDISDPLNPTLLLNGAGISSLGPQTFASHGSLIFSIRNASSDVGVTDISNPFQSDFINSISIGLQYPQSPNQIHAIGDLTYVLTDSTLQAFKIYSEPLIGSRRTIGAANDIAIKDNLAILANNGGSLQFFDISLISDPALLSTFNLPDDAFAIDLAGTVAYVATERNGLNLVDFSDPSNPSLILNIDTGRRTRDVVIVDSLAYVTDRIFGFFIYDVSNPSSPQLLSTINTFGWAGDITIDAPNNIAYVSHERFDLLIIDIADPASPTIIGSITPINTKTNGISTTTINNGLLYTAESLDGYRIFDISSPTNPVELARFDAVAETDKFLAFGFTHQITIDQDQLYLANGTGGFTTYDNTDPLNPVQTQWVATRVGNGTPSIRRIQLRDNIAYTAVYDGGFRIYDFSPCSFCPADLNFDGTLNFFDISAFLTLFNAGNLDADINGNGTLNFFDISAFLTLFAQGCP